IPATWAVTSDGGATTDATAAIAGMLLPSGGAKGFGLAFLIDLMCALLSGGAGGAQVAPLYGDPAMPYDCSHLFIAIDVAHFCDPQAFRIAATAAADRVGQGKRAPGVSALHAPGEPEWRRRQAAGEQVAIDGAVAAMLVRYARQLRVSPAPLEADDISADTEQSDAQT
ncbi:MAG: Ldh family oxidoreductase, partial [Proteobacteria bacterium]|nr:Ldh family oxidoreductase [Pseudomonadota bacterium]